MDFANSEKVQELQKRLCAFMEEHIYPNERTCVEQIQQGGSWCPAPIMEQLKEKARAAGLWNLFLPDSEYGAGLTNLEYAPLCEIMGRSPMAPEVFNCSAPDSGNMEVLVRYGTKEQKERFLARYREGKPKWASMAMTEPHCGSDTAAIRTTAVRDGDEWVLNGEKIFVTGGHKSLIDSDGLSVIWATVDPAARYSSTRFQPMIQAMSRPIVA